MSKIVINNARTHNLKGVSLEIPREKLVVITGLSGSGKSSLAFDTIYAEGQRRYIETFSAYARQFLGNLERPDVDSIEGLSPVIAIEQKTTSRSPRSTVGTITEIYDFLRLLYARASEAYSPVTGKQMVSYSNEEIIQLLSEQFSGQTITLLAPIIRSRKGHYRELFETVQKQGFLRVRVDGQIRSIEPGLKLDRYKIHDIEIVIDRLTVSPSQDNKRLRQSVELALKRGNSVLMVETAEGEIHYYSSALMCPESGVSLDLPEPNSFSFNSPKGMCPECKGLGQLKELDLRKIFVDESLTIRKGGIAPLGLYKKNWAFTQIEHIGYLFDFTLDSPIKSLSEEARNAILTGLKQRVVIPSKSLGVSREYAIDYDGIEKFILYQYNESGSATIKRWAADFLEDKICHSCNGSRLKPEAKFFKIDEQTLSSLVNCSVAELLQFFDAIEERLEPTKARIASEVVKEIRSRLAFLDNVGLNYLTLNRTARSLSGGEAQRIRLATQIGSQLMGVLYILDEPSIGLHQRDNMRLIKALEELRDIGNSVIVVEHDRDMIQCADHVIDIGPGAGRHGGQIVFEGSPDLMKNQNTLTSEYLQYKKSIPTPLKRRKGTQKYIEVLGCSGNNLKEVHLKIPLGTLTLITGVSGSGKSSLINETLYPILNAEYFNGVQKPLPYKSVKGINYCDKVIDVNQSPIGRTPRSNPATYTGVFSEIRALFAKTTEAVIRGYKAGRFSFNVAGGRCETCGGGGQKVIEMNFLPDVLVDCETCRGKRFNRETLEIRYKGKTISDVLKMTIEEASLFFDAIPKIHRILKTLDLVGLGYITLGQSSTTLSGGEAQRVKLATELAKRDTGNTIYILDEPTTGLHFEDIRILLDVLNKLVDKGNTVVVIEHNLDVIRQADYIIDIGPEGGYAGGCIVAKGTPEQISASSEGLTAAFLKNELVSFKSLEVL